MAAVRRFLFQVHMWIGLVLGILFVALGLSGSILVYRDGIDRMLAPQPRATAQGAALPLDMLVAKAKASFGDARGNLLVTLPQEAGDPAVVRMLAPPRAASEGTPRRDGSQRPAQAAGSVYLDPVSGEVIGTGKSAMSPLVQFAHDLHGGLMMGRDGRPLVGWLGVGMVILGLTGLVLWWPKPHQWKYAFRIRRNARGLRFQRELHSAFGIWSFIVFIIVSFTGVAIAFPETIRAAFPGAAPPAFNLRTGPEIQPVDGAKRIGASEAASLATQAKPGTDVVSVMIPSGPQQAISVALAPHGSEATILTMAYVDPYRAQVVALRDPATLPAADSFMAAQRPLHEGEGLGPIWRFLVFLSGFLPLLFVVTGVIMWVKKRRAHIAMNAPLPEGVAP
jgi:uncharacterized iron-regulated membrane protein